MQIRRTVSCVSCGQEMSCSELLRFVSGSVSSHPKAANARGYHRWKCSSCQSLFHLTVSYLNGLKPIRQAPYIPSFEAWDIRRNFCNDRSQIGYGWAITSGKALEGEGKSAGYLVAMWPRKGDDPMDLATVDKLLTTTRTVRKRLDLSRPAEPEIIQECLEIAIQAPTGGNLPRITSWSSPTLPSAPPWAPSTSGPIWRCIRPSDRRKLGKPTPD